MTDIIDDGNALAELHLEHALKAQKKSVPHEAQLTIGDDIICVACFGPIESTRLKHLPDAVRCISCQQDEEKRRAR